MIRRGTQVDIREIDVVLLNDRCGCGCEFVSEMQLRHECHDCLMKRLYPPNGIKPPTLIERIRKWFR